MAWRLGMATVVAGLALGAPATAGAVTVGAPLNVPANASGVGCEALVYDRLPRHRAAPSWATTSRARGPSQTPRGNWAITTARVRTGPRVGPMVFTVIRATRSQAGRGRADLLQHAGREPGVHAPAQRDQRDPGPPAREEHGRRDQRRADRDRGLPGHQPADAGQLGPGGHQPTSPRASRSSRPPSARARSALRRRQPRQRQGAGQRRVRARRRRRRRRGRRAVARPTRWPPP